MMKRLFFSVLVLVVLAALMLACAPVENSHGENDGQVAVVKAPALTRTVAFYLGGSGTLAVSRVADVDVLLDKDWEDGIIKNGDEGAVSAENLFPPTFKAKVGDVLRMNFLFDEPRFIAIEDLGFAEYVSHDSVDIKLDKKGSFDVLCLDCKDSRPALLIVE